MPMLARKPTYPNATAPAAASGGIAAPDQSPGPLPVFQPPPAAGKGQSPNFAASQAAPSTQAPMGAGRYIGGGSPGPQARPPPMAGMPTTVPQAMPPASPGAPPPAGTPPAADPQNELDQLYQGIYDEHKSSWGDTEKMINAQTAANQRRSAEVNALMGRSIGGGFGGMFAQAQLNGQMQMMGARQTWADRGRQLQLGQLDRQLTEKHRLEDLERDSGGPTGAIDQPLDITARPPGSNGRFSSRDADGNVIIAMDDGKYYKISAAQYKDQYPNGIPGDTGSAAGGSARDENGNILREDGTPYNDGKEQYRAFQKKQAMAAAKRAHQNRGKGGTV